MIYSCSCRHKQTYIKLQFQFPKPGTPPARGEVSGFTHCMCYDCVCGPRPNVLLPQTWACLEKRPCLRANTAMTPAARSTFLLSFPLQLPKTAPESIRRISTAVLVVGQGISCKARVHLHFTVEFFFFGLFSKDNPSHKPVFILFLKIYFNLHLNNWFTRKKFDYVKFT